MHDSELVTLDVKPGAAMENQSGLHMGRPRIYGRLTRPAGSKVAALLLHLASPLGSQISGVEIPIGD